jgi:hypothetical protein
MKPTELPKLLDLMCAKWITHIISTAAELELADVLKGGPSTAREIAERTKTDPAVLYRLLRALASIGLIEQLDGERFALTDLGQPLRSDVEGSLRPLAIMLGMPWHNRIWEALPVCVRTGDTSGTQHALGMNIWEYFDKEPVAADAFNRGMTGLSTVMNVTTAEAYDFSGITKLVDVGGGHGRLLGMILQRYPAMRGVLFDRPPMADAAQAELAARGVRDRCEFVGGNFLESVPSGGDAYMMSHIIHDWSDRDALTILRNCRAAMKKGAKLLVIDAIIKPGGERDWAKLVDVEMMVLYGGRERNTDEVAELFRSAGFTLDQVLSTRSLDSIAEGTAI